MNSFYSNGGGGATAAEINEIIKDCVTVSEDEPINQLIGDIWIKLNKFGIWPIASKLIIYNVPIESMSGVLFFLNATNNKILALNSEQVQTIIETAQFTNDIAQISMYEYIPYIYGKQPGTDYLKVMTSQGNYKICELRIENFLENMFRITNEDNNMSKIDLTYQRKEDIPESVTQHFSFPYIQVIAPNSDFTGFETVDRIEKEYFTLKYYQMESNENIGNINMDIDFENQTITFSNLNYQQSGRKNSILVFVAEINHPIYGTGAIVGALTVYLGLYQ